MNAFADDFVDYEDFDAYDEFDDYDEFDEDDFEEDEFLGDAWRWLTRKGSTQRRVALSAAKNALVGAGGGVGSLLGGRAGPAGALAGASGGSLLGGALAGLLPDQMDYLAELAAEAEDEDEADEFIAALLPLAARLLPSAARAVRAVAPRLSSGVRQVARTLHRNPATRQMIRQLPNIVRNTTRDIARHYAQTGNITGKRAARILARQTYRGLRKPRPAQSAVRRVPVRNVPAGPARGRSRLIRIPGGYCRCYQR